LAAVPETEHRFESFDRGIYSAEFSRKTYDAMYAQAREILQTGGSVILDASFIKAAERRKALELAEQTGARFFLLECQLDEGTARRRLARRLEKGSVSDGRWEIYKEQKERYEPPLELAAAEHVIIDTSQPVATTVRRVIDTINGVV
jgi:predicted kinase